jgi:hypothetical protein
MDGKLRQNFPTWILYPIRRCASADTRQRAPSRPSQLMRPMIVGVVHHDCKLWPNRPGSGECRGWQSSDSRWGSIRFALGAFTCT